MDRKTELDREVAERKLEQSGFADMARSALAAKERGGGKPKPLNTVEALVIDLVKAFVFKPEQVRLTSSGSETAGSVTILTLDVDAEDYGAVVGKSGANIQALRVIAQLLGAKERREYRLLMPERERRAEGYFPMPFVPSPDWTPNPAVALLRRVLDRVLSKPYNIAVIESGPQTHMEIVADGSERKWVAQLQPYLHKIFHAIGKSKGHELYVDTQQVIAK
jgi:predicted RNA-binding protein YlqC (UPF0109 family)